MELMYLAIDGDDVGNQIEYHILKNEALELTDFSKIYLNAMTWLKQTMLQLNNTEIILSGGDNLLLALPGSIDVSQIENIRLQFSSQVNSTLSMGIGNSLQEAHIALKYAKVSGKNQLCKFEDIQNV